MFDWHAYSGRVYLQPKKNSHHAVSNTTRHRDIQYRKTLGTLGYAVTGVRVRAKALRNEGEQNCSAINVRLLWNQSNDHRKELYAFSGNFISLQNTQNRQGGTDSTRREIFLREINGLFFGHMLILHICLHLFFLYHRFIAVFPNLWATGEAKMCWDD